MDRCKGGQGWNQCSRRASGDDGFCTQHRNVKANREARDQRWEVERAQGRFAHRWQQEHPGEVCQGEWQCPLCRQWVQGVRDGISSTAAERLHQDAHGADWIAYMAAGKTAAD